MSVTITRRQFVRAASLTGAALVAGACAPAAPSPSDPGPALQGEGPEAWRAEWERWVAEAKREGKLALATGAGVGARNGIEAFQQAFPEITVESQGFATPSLLIPRVKSEWEAGISTWDVAQIAIQSLLAKLKPLGTFDPLRPALIRPDVNEDRHWRDGFEAGFVDREGQYAFLMAEEAGGRIWINTDLVRQGEIKSVLDLLDPKWKGRILFQDVRAGSFTTFFAIRTNLGDDVVNRLLVDQQPAFSRDVRQITESLVRGSYPVVGGVNESYLRQLREQGLGHNVKALDLPEARIVNSGGGLWLFNEAPHPYAARVFANWVLTQQGQSVWCGANGWNSRRTDVPPADPETVPKPGGRYIYVVREELLQPQEETRKWLEQLVGQ